MVLGSEVNKQWANYFNRCTKEGRLTKDQVETVKRSCLNKGKCCFLMTRNSKIAGMMAQATQFSNRANAERVAYGNSKNFFNLSKLIATGAANKDRANRN